LIQHGEFATDYIELRRDFTAAPFVTYDTTEPNLLNGTGPAAAGDRHGRTDLSINDTAKSEETRQNEHPLVNEKKEESQQS
jgi:Amt family ammonium transporter